MIHVHPLKPGWHRALIQGTCALIKRYHQEVPEIYPNRSNQVEIFVSIRIVLHIDYPITLI